MKTTSRSGFAAAFPGGSSGVSQQDLSNAFVSPADAAISQEIAAVAEMSFNSLTAAVQQPTGRKRKTASSVNKAMQDDSQVQQQQVLSQEMDPDDSDSADMLSSLPQKRKTRTKWTDSETNDLLRGCNTYGVGNWKKILQDTQFTFNNRSAVDLKDRFRTYFPDEYRRLYPNATTHGGRRQRAPLPNALPKVNRKERRSFTADEDARLLQGFLKHGPSWSKIQKDEDLNLYERRSTDLRDRFRNAFPEKYAAAGFKTRPKSSAGGSRQSRTAPIVQDTDSALDSLDNLLNGNASWVTEDDHNSAGLFAASDLVDNGSGNAADVFYDTGDHLGTSQLVGRDDKIPIDPKVTEASARRK
ncbi:uncharacterized protein V1518DRAFT_418009 [Limtongia smithiae]|uniref:uncharacterized protein n=1 Tax=Limtongia smithiae TaxID=1125753 RepID=UPI0034CDFBC4